MSNRIHLSPRKTTNLSNLSKPDDNTPARCVLPHHPQKPSANLSISVPRKMPSQKNEALLFIFKNIMFVYLVFVFFIILMYLKYML